MRPGFLLPLLAALVAVCGAAPSSTGVDRAACPSGWLEIHGIGCYLFGSYATSWSQAQVECQNRGGFIAEIETEVENDELKQAASFYGNNYWIGLNDLANEGKWVWAATGKPAGFFDWGPNEPNGGSGADCVKMVSQFYGWRWGDVYCDEYNYPLCEMPGYQPL